MPAGGPGKVRPRVWLGGGDLLLLLWEGRLQGTRHLLLHLLALFSLFLPLMENGHQVHLCCASDVAGKLSASPSFYMSGKVESLREEGFVDCDSDPDSDWMLEAAVGGTAAADPVAVDVGAVLPATLPCSCHGC